MYRRARVSLMCFVVLFCSINPAAAQTPAGSAPQPIVTAEHESWYLSGEPLTYEGNFYYPAGALTAFNRNEMVRSGFYRGVPLYSRTTYEPYSVVFVPLAGGFMQPYQRRRAGEIGGTIGSIGPGLPVERADTSRAITSAPQAAGPPTSLPDTPTGAPAPAPSPAPAPAPALAPAPAAVGTTGVTPEPRPTATGGRTIVLPRPRPLLTAARPTGVNGLFVEFNNARWYSGGSAIELEPASAFRKIGEYHGFPVYMRSGDDRTIYVPVTSSARHLVAPYTRKAGL